MPACFQESKTQTRQTSLLSANVYRSFGQVSSLDTSSKREYEIICPNTLTNGWDIQTVPTDSIYKKISELIAGDPGVDAIFVLRTMNTFRVWTRLRHSEKQTRYALYEKELEVIKFYKNIEFHFDFHVALAEDEEGLQQSGAKLIFRRP